MAIVTHATPGTLTSILTTELNALASLAWAISAAVNNTTALNMLADLELKVAYATAPTAGDTVDVYVIPAIDGTPTYADGSATVVPQGALFVGSFELRAVNTAQILALLGIPTPPYNFKYLIKNNSAQAMPATGSTMKYRTRNVSVV